MSILRETATFPVPINNCFNRTVVICHGSGSVNDIIPTEKGWINYILPGGRLKADEKLQANTSINCRTKPMFGKCKPILKNGLRLYLISL